MLLVTQATYSYEEYPEAIGMLWKRILKDREGKNWRRIYKVGSWGGSSGKTPPSPLDTQPSGLTRDVDVGPVGFESSHSERV